MRNTLLVFVVLLVGACLWLRLGGEAVPLDVRVASQDASSPAAPRSEPSLSLPAQRREIQAEQPVEQSFRQAALSTAEIELLPLGDLPGNLKTRVAIDLQENIRRKEARLAKLRADGSDLVDEAHLAEVIELRSAQLRMLQSGDYLLLPPGDVGKAWRASPSGWRIVTYETVALGDGLLADLVFPVRIEDHTGIVDAMEYRRGVQQFTAEDAAYRFNGLESAERHVALRSVEEKPKRSGADSQAEMWVRLARSGGYRVDPARLVLTRR